MNTMIEVICNADRRITREADGKLSLAATLSEVLYMAHSESHLLKGEAE